jgi:DNA polymerase I-like protein with 3'-5' exonuclease and polymerase domains
MKYYWPDTKMQRSGYVTNTTSICNYPVQAFATAEIIPIALIYMWHYIKLLPIEMLLVNTVHDSVIAELPEEEIPYFHALSERCFLTEVYDYLRVVYGVEFTVPLAAGVKTATHWGATDEETVYQMKPA